MSDKKQLPLGRGRGSLLLEMMRQKEQEKREQGPRHSLETPSQSSLDQTKSFEGRSQSSLGTPAISTGRGRAQLSSLIKSQSSSGGMESNYPVHGAVGHGTAGSEVSSSMGSRGALGRGSLIALLQRHA